MSTKMLINAQRAGHLRVAIVQGTDLEDYQVEIAEGGLTRGNIYRGVVANIQPSLNAAFVDIGEDRHAFLPVGDVLEAAYHKKPPEGERRPKIDQVLERGKPIFVQVVKDSLGQKGAALHTNLAIAGRYVVLTPFDPVRGISRKAEDDSARKKARERLGRLDLPDGYGVIVRTNGIDQNQTMLNRDLNALLRLWRQVQSEGSRGRGPKLLYSDQDLVIQALRDYLDPSIEQVIVDSDEVHEKAESFMRAFMPRSKTRLVRYRERQPLFSRYNIETQIDAIYERRALLPSGGSIVIDSTEALTAIDVNSGRATKAESHDEAILQVNLEAAQEVARQLKLRDIGGLVVVDFIDMRMRKHQRKLEKAIRDAMKTDRARVTIGHLSQNGLLEINRQRIKQSLRHRTHGPCPTCQGVGSVPSPEFSAQTLLGRLEARAATGLMESVVVILHPEIADALQNGHRGELAELEQEFEMEIEIISSPTLARTQDRIEWTRREGPPTGSKASPAKTSALSATDLTAAGSRGQRKKVDDDDDEKNDKSRRRRRRPKSDDEKADAKPEKTAEAAPDEDDDGEDKPARRRHRGGRGRRRSSTSKKPQEKQEKEPAAEESRGNDVPERGDEGDDEPAARRRRRGSRGRGRRRPLSGREDAGHEDSGREDSGREDAGRGDSGRESTRDRGRSANREPRARSSQGSRHDEGRAPRAAEPPRDAPKVVAETSAPAVYQVKTPEPEGDGRLNERPGKLSKWMWWRKSPPEDGGEG